MYIADPIADLFARIKNAQVREHKDIMVPSSNMLVSICEILLKHGFIEAFEVVEQETQNQLKITVKYDENEQPGVTGAKRVSKPGVRIYKNYREIKQVRNGMGIGIYSTSKGVVDNKTAFTSKVGGEYLVEVW